MIKIKMTPEVKTAVIDTLSRMIKSLENDGYCDHGLCIMLPYYTFTYIHQNIIKEIFDEEFPKLKEFQSYIVGKNRVFERVEPGHGRYHFKNKLQRIKFLQEIIKELK